MTTVLDAPKMAGTVDAPLLRIGQLAARSGVTSRNLRFYADAGVFGDLPRSPKGYRLFPVRAIQWVRVLRAAQASGFSLDGCNLMEILVTEAARLPARAETEA